MGIAQRVRRDRCARLPRARLGSTVVAMPVRTSPTVRRRRLGGELRRLRELAGLTCEQAGDHLDCSASKISRIETARVPARAADVQALCQLYGAGEEQL